MTIFDDLRDAIAEDDQVRGRTPEAPPPAPASAAARASAIEALDLPPDYARFLAWCDGWKHFTYGWELGGTETLATIAENADDTFEDCDTDADIADAALVVGYSENDAGLLFYDERTRKADGSMELVSWLYEPEGRYESIEAYFAEVLAARRAAITHEREARQATREEWSRAWRDADTARFREELSARTKGATLFERLTRARIEALDLDHRGALDARDLNSPHGARLVLFVSFYLRGAPSPAEAHAIVDSFRRHFPEPCGGTIEALGVDVSRARAIPLAEPGAIAAAFAEPGNGGAYGAHVFLEDEGARPTLAFLRSHTTDRGSLVIACHGPVANDGAAAAITASLPLDIHPAALASFANDVADIVPFVSGYGGYRATARGVEAVADVYDWSRRYLGIDVHDARLELVPLRSSLKCASWLTMLGTPVADALAAQLGEDHLSFADVPDVHVARRRHGVVITAGTLSLGDVQAGDFPFAVAEVDRRIAPLRLQGFANQELLSFGGARFVATYTAYDGPFGDGAATMDWLERYVRPEGHLGPPPFQQGTRILAALDEAHRTDSFARWQAEAATSKKSAPPFTELVRAVTNATHGHERSDETVRALSWASGFATPYRTTALVKLLYALLLRDDLDHAAPYLPVALELANKEPMLAHNVACVLARSGDREGALAAVAAAIEHGYAHARAMREDADLASLAADPRFDALFASLPP